MKTLKLVAFMVFSLVLVQPSFSQNSTKTTSPKLIVVKFHADWCKTCRAMGPVFEDLQNKIDGDEVLFIKLDFTNNKTKNQSTLLGSALGISDILKQNDRRTGFVLIIDAKTKKTLQKLTVDDDVEAMETKIRTLL
ncbi:MAG: thioredoxin family protein [Zetaproteobacteria bacterium]|nr:thioredoxin family protein [Zetaproteobacteria bacterium]NDK17531.1 thioredoxin family protein [Flavobacteriales bacterium]